MPLGRDPSVWISNRQQECACRQKDLDPETVAMLFAAEWKQESARAVSSNTLV